MTEDIAEEEDLEKLDPNGIPIGEGIFELDEFIRYSSFTFSHVQVDLRHINFGTLPDGSYKRTSRSDYTKDEILAFLKMLDGLSKDCPDEVFEDDLGMGYRYREKVDSSIPRTKNIEH